MAKRAIRDSMSQQKAWALVGARLRLGELEAERNQILRLFSEIGVGSHGCWRQRPSEAATNDVGRGKGEDFRRGQTALGEGEGGGEEGGPGEEDEGVSGWGRCCEPSVRVSC